MKSPPLFILWLFLCLLILSVNASDASTQQTANAGWTEVEITPPLGIHLGGRGGPITPATKVLDPLHAQVIYLKDAKGTGLVLISMDTIGISHELSHRIRNGIVRELGVEYDLVLINCSHTHSGPYMIRDLMAGVGPAPKLEADYLNALADKIITAAHAAGKALSPATVEVFEGASKIAMNRRGKNKQGKLGIIPDPDGPMNDKLWVMKVSPTNGKAPAIVFSYACHPVIVYGYNYSAISADFPGVTRNCLREKLGKDVHVQFVQGLAGDVRPRVVADFANNRFRNSKPEDVQKAGSELAADVLKALDSKATKLSLNLAGTMDRPFLPRDKPPERELYETMAKDAKNKYRQAVAEYWLPKYNSNEGFARGDAWPLGLVRLADNQWIVYSAGEPCAEWFPLITKWLAPRNVVIWGYTQESISYLPTEEMLPQGGYEVHESNHARASTPAALAPGINNAIRESLLRQAAFIDASVK